MSKTIKDLISYEYDIDKIFTFIAHVIGFIGFSYMILNGLFKEAWSPRLIIGLSVLAGVLFTVVRLLILIAASSKHKYHFIDDLDKGGSCLTEHIINATQCIRTTHFTKESPSEGYLGTLIDKLKQDVNTRRLVFFSPDATNEYEWLNRFQDFSKFYKQYESKIWLPFNIVVIDDSKVWLFFPVAKEAFYRKAVWFDDKDLGKLFANAFDTFVDRYGSPLPPGALPTASSKSLSE